MEAEAAHATHSLIYEGVLLLGAALVFVIVFRKLGLGAVLGYLFAGALIGPQVLGLVGGGEMKLAIAEIGIVLLLFLVGLELNPARLWRLKRDIFGLGLLQVALCGIALVALVHFATSFTFAAAIAIGLPLALSSTAQVLPGLKSSGRINSPFGERVFSILLFQDISIVPLLTIVAALSRAPAADSSPPGWMLALYTLGAIVGLVLAGRFVLNPLLRLVGRLGERELFVVVGLFTVLASAAVMEMLGLSTALGAFIAGVMLADSPYRHEIESDVEPFRSILLGLFFLAVGMVLDIQAILDNPLFVLAMAAGLVIVKTAVIYGLARLWKVESKPALGLALLLSQGGEFGFVLFTAAQDAMLIENEAASLFGAIVTLSMASTPFLMMIARKLEFARSEDEPDMDGPEQADSNTAIVIGHGRFGQTVAQMLNAVDCSVTLIDKKPSQIELSEEFETKVYFGDGLRLDLLRRAGADQVKIIAFCIDDRNLDKKAVTSVAKAFPQARLLVRVFDRRHLIEIEEAGHCAAIREVFEGSIAMGRQALKGLKVGDEEIADVEKAFRHNDSRRLDKQIEAGDMKAGMEHRFEVGGNNRRKATES